MLRKSGIARDLGKFCLLQYRFHNVEKINAAAHKKISIREMLFRNAENERKSLIYIQLLSLI